MAYYEDATVTLHHGDCLEVMRTLPDASVAAVVTDPPYGLGFMGREWDALPPGREWAAECLARPQARRSPTRIRWHPHLAPAGVRDRGCGVRDPRLDCVDVRVVGFRSRWT